MAGRNQVLGQCRVTVAGVTYETDGKTTIAMGGTKRESVAGDYQASAFRESTEPGKVECSILIKPGVSLAALDFRGETVTILSDTGHQFVMRDAYTAEPVSTSTDDGKAKLVLQGAPVEELSYGR